MLSSIKKKYFEILSNSKKISLRSIFSGIHIKTKITHTSKLLGMYRYIHEWNNTEIIIQRVDYGAEKRK
jgi:hypothetical protein